MAGACGRVVLDEATVVLVATMSEAFFDFGGLMMLPMMPMSNSTAIGAAIQNHHFL